MVLLASAGLGEGYRGGKLIELHSCSGTPENSKTGKYQKQKNTKFWKENTKWKKNPKFWKENTKCKKNPKYWKIPN